MRQRIWFIRDFRDERFSRELRVNAVFIPFLLLRQRRFRPVRARLVCTAGRRRPNARFVGREPEETGHPSFPECQSSSRFSRMNQKCDALHPLRSRSSGSCSARFSMAASGSVCRHRWRGVTDAAIERRLAVRGGRRSMRRGQGRGVGRCEGARNSMGPWQQPDRHESP